MGSGRGGLGLGHYFDLSGFLGLMVGVTGGCWRRGGLGVGGFLFWWRCRGGWLVGWLGGVGGVGVWLKGG